MSLGRSAGAPPGGQPGSHGRDAGWRSGEPDGIASRRLSSAAQSWARSLVDDLVTTVFPAECRVCALPLLRAGVVPVCGQCIARPHLQTALLCRICGEALGMESERFAGGFGEEARLCTPCRRVPPDFLQAAAFGIYQGELREMVHLLKYERMRSLDRPLGVMLARAIELLAGAIPADSELLVVAVPLFRAKRRGRGFNHAELLAAAALRELRRTRPTWRMRAAHPVLARIRETESQFSLTPHARRANLRGAFSVTDEAAISGRDVLLVDDIYTTGATARACALVLRRAGARSVLVATVARAQVETVALWDAPHIKVPRAEEAQQFSEATGGSR